ncbi:hypothetical protein K438DRAFT_1780196 [Mycena galopus ATCC 62051]|nr:hypothetical protein K438DRAFT_1780196 [Mycena galopus ATCC 62051]
MSCIFRLLGMPLQPSFHVRFTVNIVGKVLNSPPSISGFQAACGDFFRNFRHFHPNKLEDASLKRAGEISTKIREALRKSLPTPPEQFFTVMIPGKIVDFGNRRIFKSGRMPAETRDYKVLHPKFTCRLAKRACARANGLFGLGLGFGCRSKAKPGRSACKPVCPLGKPVCSLSRETDLHIFLVPLVLTSQSE